MNTYVKWISVLAFVITGGLLLGGNVIADGEEETLIEADTVSQTDQIQALEAQAQSLTEQVQEYIAAQTTATAQTAQETDTNQQETETTEQKELSQDELDAIYTQVKEIAAKTEVIKIEVEKFVMVRQITEKIAYLQGEVDKMRRDEAALAMETENETQTADESEAEAVETEIAETETAPQGDVDAQIASIKAQIKDLTSQYEAQKAAEEAQSATEEISPTEIECENGVCTAKVNITPAGEEAESDKESKIGFWQSVSDFLKKIFTF